VNGTAKDCGEKAEKAEKETKAKEPQLAAGSAFNSVKKIKEIKEPQLLVQATTRGEGGLSLKTLARVRCGRDIQTSGKKGHDSVEDALAARDIAHWNVSNCSLT